MSGCLALVAGLAVFAASCYFGALWADHLYMTGSPWLWPVFIGGTALTALVTFVLMWWGIGRIVMGPPER